MTIETLLGQSPDGLAAWLAGAALCRHRVEDRTYLSAPEAGLGAQLDEAGRIAVVFLHSAGHEGHAAYAGTLPFGLEFGQSRDQVRALLGVPDRSGEASQLPFLGPKPAWDAFRRGAIEVHVSYTSDDAGISLVTLSRTT